MILSILEVDSLAKTLLIEQFNWTIEIVWKSNRKKKKNASQSLENVFGTIIILIRHSEF